MTFNITLARTYKWQTENPNDQSTFVKAIVELFYSAVAGPLHLVGVNEADITFCESHWSSLGKSLTPSDQPPVQRVNKK
jgi:hypothetical protein